MFSINTWAFPPDMPFAPRVSAARRAGFGALEVNFEEAPEPYPLLSWHTSQVALRAMQTVLQDHGCLASGICTELFWKYSLASSEAGESGKARDLALRMIECAAALKAPSIVVIPGILCTPPELGRIDRQQSSMDVWSRAVEALQMLGEHAQEMNVVLGVENVHFNSFLMSPLETRSFITSVGHPFVKAHLDIGNANITGLAHDWIDILGDQICAIHLKESIRWQSHMGTFRPLGFGSLKWNAISDSLKRIGYEHFLIVEQSYNRQVPQDAFLRLLLETATSLLGGAHDDC